MAKDTRWSKSVFSHSRTSRETRLRQVFDNVIVQFAVFGLFVTTMVLIMTAGFDVRDRTLNESIVGQVAPYTIEATQDFAYTEKDVAASNRLRQDVAAAVPSVYDWQEGLSETLRDQIRTSFSSMREAMAQEVARRWQADDPERLNRLKEQVPTSQFNRRLIDSLSAEERVLLAYRLRGDHFEPHLSAALPDASFEAFARRGFPVDVENALAAVVSDAMSNLILANVRRLDRERDNGIYLRRLRHDKLLVEYHVTDLTDRFVGLDGVPRLVDDAARRELVSIQGSDTRDAITSTASLLIRPNTTFNEAKTLEKRKAARDAVADQILHEEFRKGQIVVDKGHIVTERHYRIIQQMMDGDESLHQTQVLAGIVVLCLLLVVTLFVFGRKNIRAFRPRPKDIAFMGSALLLFLLITRVGTALSHALADQIDFVPLQAWYYLVPVAAGGMLIRLVLNSEHAVIFTILFSVLAGIIADNSLFFTAFTALGSLVGITSVQQVKNRMALMWSGLAVGVVNVAVIVGLLLFRGELFQIQSFLFVLTGFCGGVASGFFISAVLPLFEAVFSYTTDIKLLELANLNHPALRELILRAPGSYHHSMMVGSLCESAAEAIGCNPLLARVGAYYHDIGKAKNPQYFAENQKLGENPHDKLKPNMSALIIKSHVKDGLDMARQYRLPVEIQDFIVQHHGTSLIAYFFHKAKQLEDPDIPEVDEKDYRYPGPKPQTRETAICLLADSIEAASRSLPNPSPARLKGLVQNMINKAFTDGQLDECDLTLKDLNSIARAFTRILTGIYHHRPEYPGQSKKDNDRESSRDPEGSDGNSRSGKPTRSKRSTQSNSAVTDAFPKRETRPTPTGLSSTETSSDVWEISSDHEPSKEKDPNSDAGRNNATRTRRDTPPDPHTPEPPGGQHRQALPRLGTPGP